MSKRLLEVIALVAALTVSVEAAGQSASFPSIAPAEVQVTNTSSTHAVNFMISGDKCSPPIDTNLKADHYGTYTCDGSTAFSFSITTAMNDGKKITKTATLLPTKRYEIYPDASGVWNIRESSSR